MTTKPIEKKTGSRVKEIHDHYRKRGFYRYVARNVLLIVAVYALLVLVVYLTGRYLIDFSALFEGMLDPLSDRLVIMVFFASESFTGLVPVDLFVIWTQKFDHPVPWLVLLGVLSYAGGMVSCQIGRWISRWPKVKAYTERRLRAYIEFVRRWGGAFIVIAALFPFTPFSLVVIAVTLLRYPYKLFLLYALTRLVRFVIQGVLFFDVLNIDQWII